MVRAAPALRITLLRELRATIALAAPLIGGQLCLIAMNVVDVMLAGHLSAHVLGAVAVGASIWTVALIGLSGLMMAVSPTVAQLDGAGLRAQAVPVLHQALLVAGAAGLFASVAVGWGGPLLVGALGLPSGLAVDVDGFLRAVSFGAPALGAYFAARGLSEGLGVTWPTMVFGLAGLILLAPVGYILMYGAFGLPSLGARGSGLANALVCWAEAAGYLAFVRLAPCYSGLRWPRGSWRPDRAVLAGLLRLGLPMSGSLLMEVSLFSAAGLMIGGLGEDLVASHQVALNLASVTFMVPLGIALATTVRVGNAVGRGDTAGVRRAGLAGIGLALLAQAGSSMAMFGAPYWLASIYTQDAAVLAGAVVLLHLAAIFPGLGRIAGGSEWRPARPQGYARAADCHGFGLLGGGHPTRLVAGDAGRAGCAGRLDRPHRRVDDRRDPAGAPVRQPVAPPARSGCATREAGRAAMSGSNRVERPGDTAGCGRSTCRCR